MQIGKPLIIECPACGKKYQKTGILSGNTFGGVFWSDGSFFAPMMPDQVIFTKCVQCNLIFNCHSSHNREADTWEEADGLPYIEHLSPKELKEAVTAEVWVNPEEEVYLRRRLWQQMNHHPWKDEPPQNFEPDADYRSNAEALIRIFSDMEEPDYLLLAELHRNLGNYLDCLALLNKTDRGYRTETIAAIENAAKHKINGTLRV